MTASESVLPTVSVVIPAYNAVRYITRAIDSALSQTYPRIEVVVVNDGSTDDTLKIVAARYGQDARVRCFDQPNAGPSSARNHGIRESRGEFVQFLDADEWLFSTKIERSYALLVEQPETAVVYGHGIPLAPDPITGQSVEVPAAYPPLPSGWVLCDWLKGTMAGGNYGVTSSFMVRRTALIEVGGFPEDQRVAEDWDLWLRLAASYPFAALSEKLVYYDRLPEGLHSNRLNMALGRLQTFQRARYYAGREECLSDADYDRMLAGRWQVVAARYWELNRREEARAAFREAIRLNDLLIRRFYYLSSYFLPHTVMNWMERIR